MNLAGSTNSRAHWTYFAEIGAFLVRWRGFMKTNSAQILTTLVECLFTPDHKLQSNETYVCRNPKR
jgi:hypothetical protein